MKKKDFKEKLQLRKKIISNLHSKSVQGGTEMTVQNPTTIKETIKTKQDACTIIATCYCSLTCPEECGG
ncbi:hypothetical protein [uncultured Kordia sp.]|uniref:hypothetical protein n=1 Tax=uncultured Kordia sp. TaxID=507699 RepID=UPI002608E047|nr:hypothetical protein [uncultured Kordia sp.]